MNRPNTLCSVNIGEIYGIPVLLPDNMTSADIISIAMSTRHQRKLLDSFETGLGFLDKALTRPVHRRIE